MTASELDPFWSRPVRMIQPNLRMRDAVGLDGRALVRRVRDHGANAILANAGGIVAWYPTALPWHWRNPLLGRDFVGEVTGECRRLGMRALLRMDWSCLVPEIGRTHPDWLALGPDGRPRVEWAGTRNPLLRTCPNRPYWREHAFKALEELMSRYQPDGFFFNAWDLPDCRCPECRAAAKAELGEAPPAAIEWDSPFGRAYLLWRARRHAAFTKALRERIHEFDTNTILTVDYHLTNDHPHHLGRAGWDGALLTDAVDMVTVEAFNFLDRARPHWPYWAEEEARMIRSFPAGKPGIVLLSGSERWLGRRPAQPSAQIERDLLSIVAHGAHPCVAVSGDFRQEDPAVLPVTKRVFRALERRGPASLPASARADTVLVYAQRTHDLYGGDRSPERSLAHYRGWYEALSGAGVPFTVVHDGVLAEVLRTRRGLKRLILPNVACLSPADCRAVDAWVRGGGRLVATLATSWHDERGRRRPGFGLACLCRRPVRVVRFGGTWFAADARAPFDELRAWRRWTGSRATVHPVAGEFLLTGPEGAKRAEGRNSFRLQGFSFNNKPEWSEPEHATDQHGLYERRFGRGLVRYLPWAPDALFQATASPAQSALLTRLARA